MTSASKTKPGISLLQRKWFLATVAVLVVVACAVVFAPVYLRGYVRGIVEREVGARVNGVVTVDAVRLGWFSPQRLEKLAIQGGQDTGSIEVTAEVAQGLLALATADEVTVSVSGSAQTPIDAEGQSVDPQVDKFAGMLDSALGASTVAIHWDLVLEELGKSRGMPIVVGLAADMPDAQVALPVTASAD
jgi:hypothetical protein